MLTHYRITQLRGLIKYQRFVKKQPTVVSLYLYLLTSCVGLYYLNVLLGGFGFSATKHLTMVDFLSAVFSNMVLFMAYIGFAVFVFLAPKLDGLSFKFGRYHKALDKSRILRNISAHNQTWTFIVFTASLFWYANVFATEKVEQVTSNTGVAQRIYFSSAVNWLGQPVAKLEGIRVITTTNRYTFIYHAPSKKSLAVSNSNVSLITHSIKIAGSENG